MKCYTFFLNLIVFLYTQFNVVVALGITLQSEVVVGIPTLVLWTRDATDSTVAPVEFDFRFVAVDQLGETTGDAGLALANQLMQPEDVSGSVQVVFRAPGQYAMKAVSGPTNQIIGSSQTISAVVQDALPSTTSEPSPTSAPTTEPVTSASALPSSSTESSPNTPSPQPSSSTTPLTDRLTRPSSKLPRIIGGVIAGILIFALLGGLFLRFLIRRRRKNKERKRQSFHKDMMVQQHPSRVLPHGLNLPPLGHDYAQEGERNMDLDVETGMTSITLVTPVSEPAPVPVPRTHTGPSPSGPRPLHPPPAPPSAPPLRPLPSLPHIFAPIAQMSPETQQQRSKPRSHRQKHIADRIFMLHTQIAQIRTVATPAFASTPAPFSSHLLPGSAEHGAISGRPLSSINPEAAKKRLLEDMQRELVWLQDHEDSPWAMGLTDVPPPGFGRYMTP